MVLDQMVYGGVCARGQCPAESRTADGGSALFKNPQNSDFVLFNWLYL